MVRLIWSFCLLASMFAVGCNQSAPVAPAPSGPVATTGGAAPAADATPPQDEQPTADLTNDPATNDAAGGGKEENGEKPEADADDSMPTDDAPKSFFNANQSSESGGGDSAAADNAADGGMGVKVDADLPKYKATEGVSGTIKSIGSDSMNNLMTFWTQGFQTFYPNVQVEVEGKGSATAPPALIAGTANFGPMSREMKKKEGDEFESKYGYQPTALRTSIDMLAVYVHKDNPIEGLTLQQIDAIFSKNRKGGYSQDIATWGQLNLGGKWAAQAISLYGRNSASGTNGYFKEHALFGGDYKDSVKQLPGSASVVQQIATNRNAIGYSGIGYLTADVRAVPLSAEDDGDFVPAVPEKGFSGEYPLSRYLYLYVNFQPGSDLDPLRREFIRYVFSREGQQQVIKDGYLPVDAQTARAALESVGIAGE